MKEETSREMKKGAERTDQRENKLKKEAHILKKE